MGRRPEPKPRRITVIRYQLKDGTRCKKGDPGAIKKKTVTDTYYVIFPPREPGGKPDKISLETTNESHAWTKLNELIARRANEDAGIAAPQLRHAVRPISEHLAEWSQELRDGGRTSETQVRLLEGRMAILVGLAGWQRLTQIDRASALSSLARLTKERARGMAEGHQGRGAQTRNHYLRHLKQFVNWCVEDGRLMRDPVAIIEPVDVESARRHPRRSPSEQDIGTLMAYLDGACCPALPEGASGPTLPLIPPVRCGMSGSRRSLGYRVCMATGYRAKELRTLTRERFDLDAGTVRGKAAHTKDRKDVTTNLPAWLVEELRIHFDAGGGCWEQWPKKWPGRLLKLDQEACGIVHETEEGFFDFHSLRVWFCTWAANQPGISPKTLQALARHSDPRLTLKIYARTQNDEVKKVVAEMPRLGGTGPTTPSATSAQ